jgi:hypothetical protein
MDEREGAHRAERLLQSSQIGKADLIICAVAYALTVVGSSGSSQKLKSSLALPEKKCAYLLPGKVN